MIKLLKTFWEKCGEERFSAKVLLSIMTLLTVHIVIMDFYPDAVKVFVAIINFILVITYFWEGKL